MKKLFTCFAIFISLTATADQEKVCVFGSSGNICSPTLLGPVSPCLTVPFVVTYVIPSGYASVKKYEWFVNGLLIKTSTNQSDFGVDWVIESKPINVYCKVTYQKTDGSLSSVFQSNTFTPLIKDLDFPPSITTSTLPANYGCASATVSYSLPEIPCSGSFCDYTYNVLGNYNITWQAPAGWVQTSLTNNGSNVSFAPDATSAGILTATIHIPQCSYTETRTFTITRGAQAPTFTNTFVETCNGSNASVTINPTCGASNYTYTITGNPGVKFVSNGLQSLTTASTTVSLSTSGGSSTNTVKSKANYPNSTSSTDASATLKVSLGNPSVTGGYTVDGVPYPMKLYSGLPSDYNQICTGHTANTTLTVNNATNVTWMRTYATPTNTAWWLNGDNIKLYFYASSQFSRFQINASNGCGSYVQTYAFSSKDCGGCLQYQVSPNPVTSNNINIIVPNIPGPCDPPPTELSSGKSSSFNSALTIAEVKIYSQTGVIKKIQKAKNVKQLNVDVSGLTSGIYIVEISDGVYKETQKIIIQK